MVSKEERAFLDAQSIERAKEASRQREMDFYAREAHESSPLNNPDVQAAIRDIERNRWASAYGQKRDFEEQGCFCTSIWSNDGGMSGLDVNAKKDCHIHGWSDEEEARRQEEARRNKEDSERKKSLEAQRLDEFDRREHNINLTILGVFVALAIVFLIASADPGLWTALVISGAVALIWRIFW